MNATGPIRILSVDDHPMLREGIAAVLSSEQDLILIAEANNGREAIEQFRTHRPDVTLMDVQMPEVNGIDAIVKIREEFPDARIIVLTTYTGDAPGRSRLQSGSVRLPPEKHGAKGIDRHHPHGPCRQTKNSRHCLASLPRRRKNVFFLGPGAYSIDARLYGLRVTVVPPRNQA